MGNEKDKIKSFTDLNAWKEGHKLVLAIYKLSEEFPEKEQFGIAGGMPDILSILLTITSQMRRCAVSITSNISEGFTRNTNKDKYQFYSTAHGSLTELQNQLLIARDVGYIGKEKFQEVAQQTIIVSKLINGLKRIRDCKILNT